jgi:hypothetical protein
LGLDDLDVRYGRRPAGGRRRVLAAAFATALVLALAWAVWAGGTVSRARIDWRAIAVDTSDPAVVRVSFEVTQAAERAAVCSVRATDGDGQVVGWVDVPVPPSASGTATATAAVRTTRSAVGGGVVTCVRR